VTATGTAPLAYQWRKNGAIIAGANSSSYRTPPATVSDSDAQFAVEVSNAAGRVTSNAGTLTVNATTSLLTLNPLNLGFGNVEVGSSSTRAVTLTNAGNSNVSVSSIAYSGPGFTVSGVSSGQTFSPGQTATLNVRFVPAVPGGVTGTIIVASTAANSPGEVSVSANGVPSQAHRVLLSWQASRSNVAGYYVYGGTVKGGPYTKLTTSLVTTLNHADVTVQAGRTYYYVVTAVNSNGIESVFSAEASAAIP
jgi:hypothetical protein